MSEQNNAGLESDAGVRDDTGPSLQVRVTATDSERFPDLDNMQSVVLKDGPRSQKVAKYSTIRDRHTGDIHHSALSLQTYKRIMGQLVYQPAHSISLSDEKEDEIQKLLDFLLVVKGADGSRNREDYLVIPTPVTGDERTAIEGLLTQVTEQGGAELLTRLLQRVAGNVEFVQALVDRVQQEPKLFAEAAAAINLANYQSAIEELRGYIDSDERVLESKFQSLLTENPWMFGSEYSEILDRRRWTRDENQDFVVRRTSDGYIELIEIKTPLNGKALFKYDESHDSFYAGADLSKVVGQVQNYIEKLDADRYSILHKDQEDTCKIRAKIIIGRTGDEDQQAALRRFNGHLHRIEVLTFDQLLLIAERVVSYLETALRPAQ